MINAEIKKTRFKKILKNHIEHTGYEGVFSGIQIKVKDDIMSFISTDGWRLLKSEIKLDKKYKSFQAVYPAERLSKIKIQKGFLKLSNITDRIQIKINKKEMIIFDMYNEITYKIKAMDVNYPKGIDDLLALPETTYQFGINALALKALGDLNIDSRSNLLKVIVDPLNEKSAIRFIVDNDEVVQKALVMPIQIKE